MPRCQVYGMCNCIKHCTICECVRRAHVNFIHVRWIDLCSCFKETGILFKVPDTNGVCTILVVLDKDLTVDFVMPHEVGTNAPIGIEPHLNSAMLLTEYVKEIHSLTFPTRSIANAIASLIESKTSNNMVHDSSMSMSSSCHKFSYMT